MEKLVGHALDQNREAFEIYDQVVEPVITEQFQFPITIDIYDLSSILADPGNEIVILFVVTPDGDVEELDMEHWESVVFDHNSRQNLQVELNSWMVNHTTLGDGDHHVEVPELIATDNCLLIHFVLCK